MVSEPFRATWQVGLRRAATEAEGPSRVATPQLQEAWWFVSVWMCASAAAWVVWRDGVDAGDVGGDGYQDLLEAAGKEEIAMVVQRVPQGHLWRTRQRRCGRDVWRFDTIDL